MASRSAWTAKAAAWTTSLSSGCGAASNTRRSTSMLMRVWPKPRPVLAPGWTFTTRSASTRASVIAHRSKFTKKVCGYVDDRRCRPAALPPLPEQARKAGQCSPSPTYPQAPQPTKDSILMKSTVEPLANFGVSDRRFRFKPAGGFGGNRQAVSVQSGTPLRMGFGPDFGEPPLRDTSYLALACQSKYSCHYYRF